jgi:predicted DCC family thiol-disulfide oxidoreductase YuxK
LVRLDRKKRFYFSPRDSKYLKSFDKLPKRGADESIYYLRGEEIYDRSDAVLYILKDLGWPFRLLTLFFVFPKSWRDRFYSWVARNRYRWFGQKSACMQPRQEVKDRFLF